MMFKTGRRRPARDRATCRRHRARPAHGVYGLDHAAAQPRVHGQHVSGRARRIL